MGERLMPRLAKRDELAVVDAAEVGDLFYGEMTEDGDRPICRPDVKAIVSLTTERGEVYHLAADFGADFERAQRMVDRIMKAGAVNLDHWTFIRVVYGSDAYIDGGYEAERDRAERADAGCPVGAF